MATAQLGLVVERLRKLVGPRYQNTDSQLLEQFVLRHDEQAFATLVKQHGPMVLGVCRAVLGNGPDAEDAFQATFLVLVRRAASLDRRQSLGGWLHAVAWRIARKARAISANRRRRERQAMNLKRDNFSPPADALDYTTLHEELERLPKKYRLPLVLCYLEDKTQEQAAKELGWPLGSMSWCLARGRELLRKRLQRRGWTLASPALLAMMVASSSDLLPAPLVEATLRAALLMTSGKVVVGGALSAPVATLIRSACLTLVLVRLKIAGIILTAACLLTTCILVVVAAYQGAPSPRLTGHPDSKSDDLAHAGETPMTSQLALDGPDTDPLPPGAVARLGSTRMRPGHVVGSVAFSPDGMRLASGNWGPGIHIWNAATGKEIRRFATEHQGLRVVYLPDGKTVASVGGNDKVVRLWDSKTGAEHRQLVGHEGNILALAPAPDGKLIASAGYDKTVRLWQVAGGKQIRQFDHSEAIRCLAWSHDNKVLAAGAEGQVRLWESDTGKLLRELSGHERTVSQLAWSPDDRVLASGGSDGTIRLWDPKKGDETRRLGTGTPEQVEEQRKKADADKMDLNGVGYLGWVHGLAFSHDGTLLYSVGQDFRRIFVWDVASGKELRRLEGPQRIFCLAPSADGKTLAVGGAGGHIDLWDMTTEKRIHPLTGPQGRVDALAFSPDGKVLATAGDDQNVRIWETSSWRELQRLPRDHPTGEPVGFLRFSADSKYLGVCAPPCSRIFVWDWAAKKEIRRFVEGRIGSSSHALAFSPDGKMLAAPLDGVTVWDLATGKVIHNFECRSPGPGYAYSLEFSPDGSLLALGSIGTIYLCEPISGKVVRVFEKLQESVTTPSGHKFPNMARGLAFSADGRSLLSGGYDAKLRLWETATGKQRLLLDGHEISIQSVAISPNGKYLASGSGSIWDHQDNTGRLWDAATGKELRRFTGHQNVVVSIAFSADGRVLASGSEDGTVLIWDVARLDSAEKSTSKALSANDLDSLWADLAGEDAAKAYRAIHMLASAPNQALTFLEKNLKVAAPPDEHLVSQLIADLDSDQFDIRQKAVQELENLRELAEAALKKELQGKPSPEKRRRIESLLASFEQSPTGTHLREIRAIEVLEHISAAETRDLLQKLATGAPNAKRTQHAKSSLQRLRASASGNEANHVPQ